MGNCISCMPDSWTDASDDIEEILREAETGDLILFQGRGLDAKIIRYGGLNGKWSHVGMFLRDPQTNALYITEEYPTLIGPEMIHGPPFHTGAQVTDATFRLRTYPSGKFAWRKLVTVVRDRQVGMTRETVVERLHPRDRAVLFANFIRFFTSLNPIPKYNLNLIDFAEYGTRGDAEDDDNDGKYVCTSWATKCAIEMGIFTPTVYRQDGSLGPLVPGNVTLTDYDGMSELPTVQGLRYEALRYYLGPKRTWEQEGVNKPES